MKKLLLFIFVELLIITPVLCRTLQGGVSYTVEQARQVSFNNIAYQIDIKLYKKYFKDENREKNLELMLKGRKYYHNRYLTYFSDGDYSVWYKKNPRYCYYYDKNGNLKYIGIDEKTTYPKRSYKYDINGKLDSVTLSVLNSEDFMFDVDKNLKAHWIGNNCYNEKGELIKTRE